MNFRLSSVLSFEAFLLTNQTEEVLSNPNKVSLNVKVYPSWFQGCSVTWTRLPAWTGKEVSFNIYRSENPEHGWVKLNAIPLQQTQFKDETVKSSTSNLDIGYIIEAIVKETPSVTALWRTPVATVADELPRFHALHFKEINRRHWVLLRKLAGTETMVLRKKNYGPRCHNCWDDVSNRIVVDNCTVCYGTGIEGGYYEAIPTLVQFDSSNNTTIYSYFGKFEPNEIGAWTISYPLLETHDILIRKKDLTIFRVEGISPTEMLNKPCRQIMKLVQLPKTHPIQHLIEREGLIP